jgi:glycogen operon protein
MGDEFGNSQLGNNNAYCQDNEISWLNWNDLETNKNFFQFFKYMIQFRKDHSVIRRKEKPCSIHFPEMSAHGNTPWVEKYNWESKVVGIMYAGSVDDVDDMVYVVVNSYWGQQEIELPGLLGLFKWKLVVDTFEENSILEEGKLMENGKCTIGPRSALVFVAEPVKKE